LMTSSFKQSSFICKNIRNQKKSTNCHAFNVHSLNESKKSYDRISHHRYKKYVEIYVIQTTE
jgi:hypothetical protein